MESIPASPPRAALANRPVATGDGLEGRHPPAALAMVALPCTGRAPHKRQRGDWCYTCATKKREDAMIVIENRPRRVEVTVYAEFTLADYQEFENAVNYVIQFEGQVDLFFDLREMADFTLDVAWEDIVFSRAHAKDFSRIAVLTESQWVAWSAWLSQIFVEAEMRVFDEEVEARAWLAEGEGEGLA